MKLTFLADSRDVEGTPVEANPQQLSELFTTHLEGPKDGLAFIPGTLKGPRDNANVETLTALVLDCDHMSEATYDAAQRALIASGFAFYIYETHGHAPPADCRFRAILPFGTPFTHPGHWKTLRARLLEHLGMAGYVDASTGDPARLYFTPRHDAGGAQEGYAGYAEDRPELDWRPFWDGSHDEKLQQGPRTVVSVLPATPIDLEAVRKRLGAIRRPDWALSLGRVIKGEAPSPSPDARAPNDPPRRLAWRDVTCALSLVSQGEGLALLEVLRPSWEAEQRETPTDYTPWPYVVEAFERALADVPRIRAERAAREEQQRAALLSMAAPVAPAAASITVTPLEDDRVFLPKNQRDFALAIRALWGKDIRCLAEANRWYLWNGTEWAVGEIHSYIGRMIERLEIQAGKEAVANPETATAFLKIATRAGNDAFMNGVANILAKLDGIRVEAEAFDQDPDLINMPNGTFDVRTNQIREHRREDMITHTTEYPAGDSSADCPLHRAVLERALPDPAMREAFQVMIGYMSLGHVSEQKVFFAVGDGSNGKSTLFNMYLHTLGSYAILGSKYLISDSLSSDARLARLSLQGRRFVLLSETGANERLNEAQVKSLTGGEPVQTRAHYGSDFSFPATHKIIAYTNHKPRINGAGDGIWRRLYLVLFGVKIPESEWDKGLPNKLKATEGPAIMRWILEGARKWHEQGLSSTTETRAAVDAYKDSEDTLSDFLDSYCEVGAEFEMVKADLHRAHCEYRDRMRLRAWEPGTFYAAVEERGIKYKRTKTARLYLGIRLKVRTMADKIQTAATFPRRAQA